MTRMHRALRLALAIGLGGWAMTPAWAGWPEGQAAYDREQYPEAIRHFKPLADQGDPQAQAAMAQMYRFGLGVPKDPKTALAWLRKAEAQGHAQSIFLIGEMKEFGEGEPADLAGAVVLYRRAAELGYPRAQAVLGALYADGVEVPQDDAQAVHWYEKAAAQGDAIGLTNLGRLYQVGRHVSKDAKRAVALFEQAAQKGHARAQAELGVAYLDAIGVKEDAAAGVKWLSQAAEGGSAFGQFRLAWAYLEGQGVPADATQAAKWFQASADQGFSAGMRETGRRLELGEGVSIDLAQARSWYERAAQAGDRLAMYYLAGMHDEGRGVVSDKAHAVYWYLRAARQGEINALNDLGAMYFNGEYVARDLVLAYGLFKRAADGGQANGRKNLDRTQAELGRSDLKRALALSATMDTPEGLDAALDASLAMAQGKAKPAAPVAGACVQPTPDVPRAQFEAWVADAHDRGFLWRIRKAGRTSHLYGTLHVSRLSWTTPGPRLMSALDASDVVAVEADLNSPDTKKALSAVAGRPSPLDDAGLQGDIDKALGVHCAETVRKNSLPQWVQLTVLTARDAASLDLYPDVSADIILPLMAREKKLPVESLEDTAKVMGILESQTAEEHRESIRFAINGGPERRQKLMKNIVRIWAQGDLAALENTESWCECKLSPRDRAALRRLNDDRNVGMAQRIDELHTKGQRVLAAVGSLHMTGPQSLLKLLADRGYEVERVAPQRPPGTAPDEIRVTRGSPAGR